MPNKKLSRDPRIENKYNLDINKIKKLQIGDRNKICEPLFWRNNVVNAWCICDSVGPDICSVDYWIGIYDDDAEAYAGKLRVNFSSYGGMCGYTFNKFFKPSDIENNLDFEIQEKFLEKINYLIDNGILIIANENS